MTVPDFDNIDLAIIVIGLVMIVVAIGLMISGKIEAGLGFLGTGVTAIAGLAKGKQKKDA
jgi:hypothetical protein